MQRAENSRPLEVLIVAEDRRLLRHLSKLLIAFGYAPQQAADRQQALAILEGQRPDILLVDAAAGARSALELCRSVASPDQAGTPFIFFLVDQPEPDLLTEALEAGVEDFLIRPVVYGELLARLRAAARVLEFERRLGEQARTDPLTGLPRQLPDPLPGDDPARRRVPRAAACVLADLDLLGRMNRLHGRLAGDAAIRAAADCLRGLAGEAETLFCFGGGRFCVWVQDASEDDAAAWAECARQILAETEVPGRQGGPRCTASLGVAARDETAISAEAVLARAEHALQAAKHSGRNAVVRYSQLDDDSSVWADFAAPGKLFERTRARDVMTPCTLTLQADQPLDHAAALLARSPQAALPIVDRDGRLTGLVLPEHVVGEGDSTSARVEDRMAADPPSLDEDAEFDALRDFFTQDSRSVLVITYRGRPTGLLTPDNLAALGQPLAADTFAPSAARSQSSDYLVVSDLQPLS